MYRKLALVFSALVFFSGILSAQPWKEKPSGSKKPNFHSMKAAGDALLEPVKAQRGKGFKALKRWENYWETRVNANGDFPAANQLQQSWNTYIKSPGLAAPVPGSSWSSMGPTSSDGGYAGIGRINRVAFHPTNSSTYFANTAGGGLWKTTNGGSSWTSLTDNLASIGTSGLVINPTNTDIMYLATGDGDGYDTYSYGVLKTTDGGTNWSATGLTFTPGWVIYKIVMHPNDPNTLLVGTNGGIFRTTDAGATWTQVVTNISAYDLEFKPGDPTYVYAGADGSVYRSTSTGASGTWTQVGVFTGGDRTAIAVSANNPSLLGVLVSRASDAGFLGYYTSINSGTSFSVTYNGPSNLMGWESDGSDSGGQGWYDLCMAIDPNNANNIYVGGVNVWKSTDGGSTWTIAGHWYGQNGNPEIHADHHDLSFQPGTNTLFSTNDGGIYSYNGSAWADRTNGMAISQMYRISASQTTTKVISGLQDNGTKLLSTTGTWTDVNGGDGMECGIDPSNANYMYSTVYYGSLYRSTNGSPFWQDEITPANSSGAWVSPFVMDPVTPSTIYLGHKVLWKS
ncbi:MAG: hypothetical protein RL181_99, partial [Bacteroidota bacterium]